MLKRCTAGQDIGHNIIQRMSFACRINRQEYRHALRICNTCCFSSATMVTQTRLSVTLYVQCLSCFVPVSLQELHPVRVGLPGVILFVFGFVFGDFVFPRILHSQVASVSLNPTNAVQ
jgi:hypothetical protein